MPKQRITKEMVVEAAFEIARKEGAEKVIVKNIAERLGCSVQPIYSYCSNMEGLREELVERTRAFMKDYIASRLERTNYFWSMGQAQIHFAKEDQTCSKCISCAAARTSVPCRSCIRKKAVRTWGSIFPKPCRSVRKRPGNCTLT